ncbi:hypothetical protein K1T71_001556 [Dendrolimus kikuchii]|uniref:Uncharacterized protein n=1 Tax=Dendrolimus kikuchii TaxID=765133 RepID=A0ACC1DF06_9NEOP|nr:hypothetical protein K1T71_001556 [Dendrolimus kikuchii]
MEAEIADLRQELRSLRDELSRPRADSAPPPPPPPEVETNMAANLERMTLLMENRFAAIEEQMRSVRPAPSPARTLSPAPRARPTPPPTSPIPGPSVEEYPPLPQRGRKKRAVAMSTPPPPPCPAPTTSSAAAEDGWTTVSKKKAPRKAAQPSSGTQPAATAADAQTTRARRQRGRGRGRKEKGDRKPRDPLRAGYPSPGPHRRGRPCLRGGQPLAGGQKQGPTVVRHTTGHDCRGSAAHQRTAARRKGRGRPPTTGEYVGLAAAKQKLVEAQRAQLELEMEKEVAERTSAMVTTRATRLRAGPAPVDPDPPATEERGEARAALAEGLQRQIAESLAVVSNVAKVSKGLKGTLQKALKEAAVSIQEATDELLSRTSSEEVALLRAANSRMEAEIADLRRELRSLREEVTRPRADIAPPPLPPPPEAEKNVAANLERLTLLMESRFAAIEEQMRSAPRARPTPPPSHSPTSWSSAVDAVPRPTQRESTGRPAPPSQAAFAAEEGWSTVVRRRGGQKKAAPPSAGTQPAATAAQAPTTRAKRRAGRGRKGKGKGDVAQEKSSQPPPPPPRPEKKGKALERKAPRLRPPTSSAVVLTIQPAAVERGRTYADLLSKAKANIRLADLGIEGGLRLKRARTGARMLLLPGTSSAPQADALAERLRTVLEPEYVRVTRPEKTVYLRISGLDDTTEDEDVAAAIARTTTCSLGSLKASKVRPGPDGMGTTVVACPVAAAKMLLAEGAKLLVGWASATVQALPHRAQRCFRCHETGHVAAACTSEVDRSGSCYRCGQLGHLVTGPCTAKPHCSLCEAAGRPAGHQLGGGACKSKTTRRRKPQQQSASRTAETAPEEAAGAAATTAAAKKRGKK